MTKKRVTKTELKKRAGKAWDAIYDAGDSALDALSGCATYDRLFDACDADVEKMVDMLSLEEAKEFVAELEDIASEAEFF